MERPYLTTDDIRDMFNCGRDTALRIMRSIKIVNAGSRSVSPRGALGRGKVLLSEFEYWKKNQGAFYRGELTANKDKEDTVTDDG